MTKYIKLATLIAAVALGTSSVNAATNKQCMVTYKTKGGTVGWSVTAKSTYEAESKWKKKIKRPNDGREIVDIQCK